MYWSFDATVSADGSTITFELIQQFSGDACREQFGTAPRGMGQRHRVLVRPECNGLDARRLGSGERVGLRDGIDFKAYRITSDELAGLLAGEPPADDAPDGFAFAPTRTS